MLQDQKRSVTGQDEEYEQAGRLYGDSRVGPCGSVTARYLEAAKSVLVHPDLGSWRLHNWGAVPFDNPSRYRSRLDSRGTDIRWHF
jgi:hypothetical protein